MSCIVSSITIVLGFRVTVTVIYPVLLALVEDAKSISIYFILHKAPE